MFVCVRHRMFAGYGGICAYGHIIFVCQGLQMVLDLPATKGVSTLFRGCFCIVIKDKSSTPKLVSIRWM